MKYEHTQLDLDSQGDRLTRLLETAGYHPTAVTVGFSSLDQAASHHVEITPPPGVQLIDASLLALQAGKKPEPLSRDKTNPDIAHLRFTAEDAQRAITAGRRNLVIQVQVWAAWGPLAAQALLVAIFNVVVLSSGLAIRSFGPGTGWDLHRGTAGASILVAAPAALAIVAAIQEHRLAYRVQRVLRYQLLVGVGVSFATAASLALDGFRSGQLVQLWGILFILAAADCAWVISSRVACWIWQRV